MKPNDKIIYRIVVEDIQKTALVHIERPLTDEEIELVANRLNDFIDWTNAIENAIDFTVT